MLEINLQKSISSNPNASIRKHKWGFDDTNFVVNHDSSVMMTGNRYNLSGIKLYNLLPYIEKMLGVKINWQDCLPEVQQQFVSSPNINKLFCQEIQENFNLNQYSFRDSDRLLHSHGEATCEEVYKVISSQLDRNVDMVFYCESEDDAQKLIQLAIKHNVCLIPFGGGTNVSCALKLPKNETRMIVAVDMRPMNKIEWIDRENLRACVQAGITGSHLEELLKQAGFTCGHEPDSLEFSTLGGWIATNASGMKRSRYGNIEEIVENITMITPSGILEQIQSFARVSMGIQTQNILFGSEGNLGLITKAVIKIHPLPEVKEYSSVIFPNFDLGVKFLNQLAHSGSLPASVRLVDNQQFGLAQALKPQITGFKAVIEKLMKFYILKIRGFDPEKMAAATIVFEGSGREVAYQKATVKDLAQKNCGIVSGAKNGQRGYMLTFAIAYIRDFMLQFNILGETFETTVPWGRVQQVCKSVEEKLHQEHQKYHLPGKPFLTYRITQLYHTSVCIYFTLCIYTKNVDNPEVIVSEIDHSLRQTIMDNGGSISHHHGVGKLRSGFIQDAISPSSIELVKNLKQSLDPDNIFGVRNNVLDV